MVSIEQYKRNIKLAQMRYKIGCHKMVVRGFKKDARKKELMKKYLCLEGALKPSL